MCFWSSLCQSDDNSTRSIDAFSENEKEQIERNVKRERGELKAIVHSILG